VGERVLRRGSRTVRPLASHLGLRSGGYTRLLQRAIVDFGSEDSFARASERLYRHHRIALSASSVRKVTLTHARAIEKAQQGGGSKGALPKQGAERIIAEMDGTMLPVVECRGRKSRSCHWKEMRLSAARVQGETRTRYAVSAGSVEQAGYDWAHLVAEAGWGMNSALHVVSDGAPWIQQQCAANFGSHATFLLDFFHLCEYLAAAAPGSATHPRWLQVQKDRLKRGQAQRVLDALQPFLEPDHIPDEQAPIRAAHRYLQNRLDQVDYPHALKHGLPIGSGMIEGGHRHVLQKRLKISGAWWHYNNASAMAHLRVCRANQKEDSYWNQLRKAA